MRHGWPGRRIVRLKFGTWFIWRHCKKWSVSFANSFLVECISDGSFCDVEYTAVVTERWREELCHCDLQWRQGAEAGAVFAGKCQCAKALREYNESAWKNMRTVCSEFWERTIWNIPWKRSASLGVTGYSTRRSHIRSMWAFFTTFSGTAVAMKLFCSARHDVCEDYLKKSFS